ncbi:MAG: hypothetical protein DRJ10_11570 [Bacteroidetes bacterium]|nr:MAG: hypothetical protein DRJ10_11570 [Bacteroidota bacterium]
MYQKNNRITAPVLAENIGLSEPTIHRYLKKLIDENVIHREGSKKTGLCRIKKIPE